MSASLLVELFTEELPPKALKTLGEAFAHGIASGLAQRGLLGQQHERKAFCTPRRLAVHISKVLASSLEREQTKKLMPAKVAFDPAGNPAPALLKRLAKEGYAADADMTGLIERRAEGDAEYVFLHRIVPGIQLAAALQSTLEETITRLPIPKVMSYQLADGTTTVQFVRPVHGLLALHGTDVLPVSILGLNAGRITHGHRFQGVPDIPVVTADAYEEALAAHGQVIAAFDARRAETESQLREKAAALGASLGPEQEVAPLLDEVTALVEHPSVYVGEFERDFLAVPQECLILTMRQNQKYFPLFDAAGKLTNKFLIVSNMRLSDPGNIVEGNNRVVRPRLADARFFFETDKKIRLEARVPQLGAIVYHNKLGTQLERVERVQLLAGKIAREIGADPILAERAAWLAKADLVTNMVGEFPELQGTMGRYYALADGESPVVAEAIEQHYWPRFSGDNLPTDNVGACVALADKLISIMGIFGADEAPTGEKDPYALRRSALGFIRILIERRISLDTIELINQAAQFFLDPKIHESSAAFLKKDHELRTKYEKGTKVFAFGHADIKISEDAKSGVYQFILERLRGYLRDREYTSNEIEAVLALKPSRIDQVVARMDAVRTFAAMPESQSLAGTNKRIGNILKKVEDGVSAINFDLLTAPSEIALAKVVGQLQPDVRARFAAGDYAGTLRLLSQVKDPVDIFFNDVMVMADDLKLRANRIALLRELHGLMNQVADISKLAP